MSDATPFQKITDVLLQLHACIHHGYLERANTLIENTMDNLREILSEEHTQISDNTPKQTLTAPVLQSMMRVNANQIRWAEENIQAMKNDIQYINDVSSDFVDNTYLYSVIYKHKQKLKRLVSFQKALKRQYKDFGCRDRTVKRIVIKKEEVYEKT